MKLRLGLIGQSQEWETLLRQEGVPFTLVTSTDQLRPEDFSVAVVSSTAPQWNEVLKGYVRNGGAMLTSALHYQRCFGGNGKHRKIRYLLPEHNSPFSGIGLVDAYCEGIILEQAKLCSSDRGEKSIAVEQYGGGMIAALPFDLGSLYYDTRKTQKYFYSPNRKYPSERVSLLSKGAIRRLAHVTLELLHNQRGIPYCHLWYYPEGANNIFALRIDSDFGTEAEIETLYRFAEDNSTKMSWYLHVQSHENWLSKFQAMRGHEIGVHCYEHAVLRSASAARADIAKAKKLLDEKGISLVGFAAPFGDWSEDLGGVLQEIDFLYSSEFSYDYDNVPSFPLVNGHINSVLQIPIHPICIGSFNKLKVSEREMIEYFTFVMDMKRANHEPLFFYHHPKDGHHAVLKHLIDTSKEMAYPNILLRDFAQWWKERITTKYSLELSGDRLQVNGSVSSRQFLRLSKANYEAIVSFANDINLTHVKWREKMPVVALPDDIGKIRSFSLRLLLDEFQARFRRVYK